MEKGAMLTLADKEDDQCKNRDSTQEGCCGQLEAGSSGLVMVPGCGIFNLVLGGCFTIWWNCRLNAPS